MNEFLADFRYGFTHPGEEFRFRARQIARVVRAATVRLVGLAAPIRVESVCDQ